MYFREYFCSFSSKSYYFYILGVSHLNLTLRNKLQWNLNRKLTHFHSRKYIWKCRLENGGHLSRPQCVNPCLPSPMHDWAAGATDPASSLKPVSHQTALRNIVFHYREWSTCLLNWGKIYGYSYIWHNTERCQIGWSILLFIFISEFIFH